MKTMSLCVSSVLMGLVLSNVANAKSASRLSVTMLTSKCQDAARGAREGKRGLTNVLTPLDPISLRGGYTIQVFSLRGMPASFDKTVIGIIEKSQQSDAEVPQFTAFCVGDQLQPPHGDKGNIYFVAHKGEHVPIHFHLNKKVDDPGYLAIHNWKASGQDSLAMSGPFMDNEPTTSPQLGQFPNCLDPSKIKVNGANLSFDFDRCLATSENYTYVYLLFVLRTDSNGPVTVPIDPQIINHPH